MISLVDFCEFIITNSVEFDSNEIEKSPYLQVKGINDKSIIYLIEALSENLLQIDFKELKQRMSEGYQFIAYSIDSVIINHGSRLPIIR